MDPEELLQVENSAAETRSEISEGTTTTTTSGSGPLGFYSHEELTDIAAMLQVDNVEDLHRDRFRVNRQKLEQMLLNEADIPEPADIFFRRIMSETNTLITWPTRLKIGAKSKKDPHMKVVGRFDDVEAAKEKIMEKLDTRQNLRATMKVDVSYTDHSHIIGKGGLTIKRVMEETKCHIHFPDSNRSNHQEKSNQVSIAGEIEGIEKARARIRNLTPLIFSFELPIMGSVQSIPDSTTPDIIKIQEKYNIQVMFRTRPKLHSTLVLVRGCEWEVQRVKDATVELIKHMCKHLSNQIQIHMAMEISPQHHSTVLGKHNSNLKLIMQRTVTQIIFPDAGDPNVPNLKKSNVIIIGGIDNVYAARQQLIGSLPLVLMFDVPEKTLSTLDTENISNLMELLDVFINVRFKPKQNTQSIIIKGMERHASKIYEARRQLLQLEGPHIHAAIPPSYYISNANTMFLGSNINMKIGAMRKRRDSINEMLTIDTANNPYGMSSMSPSPNNSLSPYGWNVPHVSPMYSSLMSQYPADQVLALTRQTMQTNMLGPHHAVPMHGQSLLGDYLSLSSTSSTLSTPGDSPRNISPISYNWRMDPAMLSDCAVADKYPSQANLNCSASHSHQSMSTFDYQQKKIHAMKAMRAKPKSTEFRVPTTAWAGYGFSQTMPTTSTEPSAKDFNDNSEDPTTPLAYVPSKDLTASPDHFTGIGMNSNILDEIPRFKANEILFGPHTSLDEMLISIGLDKYIRVFASEEIDLITFRSLTDKDLSELGITAWGARRKILLLIAELNKRTMPFSGSAAPGAERKSSLTNASSAGQAISSQIASENTFIPSIKGGNYNDIHEVLKTMKLYD